VKAAITKESNGQRSGSNNICIVINLDWASSSLEFYVTQHDLLAILVCE